MSEDFPTKQVPIDFATKQVRIYYLYPFVTSAWAPRVQWAADRPGVAYLPKKELKIEKCVEYEFSGNIGAQLFLEGPNSEGDKTGDHQSLEPAAYLPLLQAYCKLRGQGGKSTGLEVTVQLDGHQQLHGTLDYEAKVRDCGAGCAALRLDLMSPPSKPFTSQEVISLAGLGQKKCAGVSLHAPEIHRDDLYGIFRLFNKQFVEAVGKALREQESPYVIIEGVADSPTSSPEVFEWVDLELRKRIETEADQNGKTEADDELNHHENPAILTVIGGWDQFNDWTNNRPLPGELCKDEKWHNMTRDLCAILLRAHDKALLDNSFLRSSLTSADGHLKNMSPLTSFFIHCHLRSCLVVCDEMGSRSAALCEPWLKETLMLLRMRWYHLVITNILLDECLHTACQFLKDRQLGGGEEKQIREAHRRAIWFRKHILMMRARALRAFQDPITYRIGSGSLIEIYEKAALDLDLPELERHVSRKLDSLGAIYRDVVEHCRLEEGELQMQQWQTLWASHR